ncbi:putative leucine zipper transcription factor-like protein 1 isoform X4 [Apostichopus japonicus]|uniref:Leucine zipper transcription factor-like protein 1 n=1 Tax=Stichopus japonicus TaxID=307972 RepID=A0A2G8LEL3_STIJA|nr:putative leucine zipper transcription factor-like protein 1 isoform X4 [Apostichopus japonicus]
MSSNLGLNEHHHDVVLNYLRFARYKRSQNLRGVEGCFQDVKDSRLTEDTFTSDEVEDILDGLEAVVRGEVESELININHTNVLLLRQFFQQAEKWHLKLQADISELENRELIELIADFEESQFAGAAPTKPSFEMKRLDPMESGDFQLLQNEIDRLNKENEQLKERLKTTEIKATEALTAKSRLASELSDAQSSPSSSAPLQDNSEAVADLESQLAATRMQAEKNLKLSGDKAGVLEDDLVQTKHKLLEVQEQLELKGKELDKKFSGTATYKNLKAMLVKKNDQLKELRGRLAKYEEE